MNHLTLIRISNGSSFPLGLYCSGWLKTGPTGVIATTMNNSFDTARSLLEDIDSGTLDVSAAKPGSQSINALLEKRGMLLSSVTVTCPDELFGCFVRSHTGTKLWNSKVKPKTYACPNLKAVFPNNYFTDNIWRAVMEIHHNMTEITRLVWGGLISTGHFNECCHTFFLF